MGTGYLVCSMPQCSHCNELIRYLRANYNPSISDTEDFSDGTIKIIHDVNTMKRLGVTHVPFIFVIELDRNNQGIPDKNKTISPEEFKKVVMRLK